MSFGGISSSHVYLDIFPCSLVRVLKCSFWGQAKPSLNFLHKMKSPAAGTYGWCRIRVAATACCSPNHWHFNWSPFITGLQSDLTVNEPFHDCDLNYLLLLSKYVEMENKNPNPKHWNLSKRLSRRLCAALFLLSGKRISTPGFQTSGDISNSLSFNLHHWLTQAVSRGTVSGHEQGRMEPSLAALKPSFAPFTSCSFQAPLFLDLIPAKPGWLRACHAAQGEQLQPVLHAGLFLTPWHFYLMDFVVVL